MEAQTDLTLDPENWGDVHNAFARALSAVIDKQAQIREEPVWQPHQRGIPSAYYVTTNGFVFPNIEAPNLGCGDEACSFHKTK